MRPPPMHCQSSLKPFCFGLLLVCWALFRLHGDPAEAYFETRISDENAWLAVQQDQAFLKRGSYRLGLYAALGQQKGPPKAEFALLPATDSRLPLDEIDCNPPVILGLSRRFTSLDFTFQTLLYADLKLKRLMAEYALLQERAHALLGKQSETVQTAGNTSREPQTDSSPSFAAAPLHKKIRLMEARKSYESRLILQTRAEHVRLESLQSLLSGSLASLETSAEQSSQSLDAMVKSILASQDRAAEPGTPSSEQKINTRRNIRLESSAEETELPWLFQVLDRKSVV